jgi:hypothetical protein
MLANCTYRVVVAVAVVVVVVVVVVVERCLPAASWGVTVAMDISEDVHHIKVYIYRSDFVLRRRRYHWIRL